MQEEINREMYRSRRYGHPITLLRISPPPSPGDDTEGPRLITFVRLIDRAWTMDSQTWLLLPETDLDAALSLLDRIRADAPALLTGRTVGLAIFPETALTLEGLLAVASERSEEIVRIDARRSHVSVVAEPDETVSQSAAK